MDQVFLRPGERPFLVRGWGNFPIELLAALAGVKPVTHCWVDDTDLGYVEELCAAFGLRHLVFGRQEVARGTVRLEVMIGKDASMLRECADIWHAPDQNPGVLLGYPACCVEEYMTWHRRYVSCDAADYVDVINWAFERTHPRPERISFLVNDVFYLYSRRWGQNGPLKRQEIVRRNTGLDLDLMNVVPWHPCRYDCPESLRKAEAVWALMLTMAPKLAVMLKTCLARPVLFWEWSRFAVLKGRPTGDGFAYDGVQPPFSLLEPERIAEIRPAAKVRARPDGSAELLDGSGAALAWKGAAPLLLGFAE